VLGLCWGSRFKGNSQLSLIFSHLVVEGHDGTLNVFFFREEVFKHSNLAFAPPVGIGFGLPPRNHGPGPPARVSFLNFFPSPSIHILISSRPIGDPFYHVPRPVSGGRDLLRIFF